MKPLNLPVDQAALDRKRELDIKEREVAAKEREVLAKEQELKRSRWLNPTVIGLFAAALGLIGSVIVARVNNANTQEVERIRSQSNLVLEAIRTGNPTSACKNLVFFVNLGLLADEKGTIANQCKSAPQEAPSLPVAPSGTTPTRGVSDLQEPFTPSYVVRVGGTETARYSDKEVLIIGVSDGHEGISGARVSVTMKDSKTKKNTVVTGLTEDGKVTLWIKSKEVQAISVNKDGFENYDSKHAFLPLVPSFDQGNTLLFNILLRRAN